MKVALLEIVQVMRDDRVYCQHPTCNRTVYKRIHVVEVDGRTTFVGSGCFKKYYRPENLPSRVRAPSEGSGIPLTADEVLLLKTNTEELLRVLAEKYSSREKEPASVPILPADDAGLWQYALEMTKQRFRTEKGINPELPGWVGWVEADAKKLYGQLKTK